jgi:hypothetical protein
MIGDMFRNHRTEIPCICYLQRSQREARAGPSAALRECSGRLPTGTTPAPSVLVKFSSTSTGSQAWGRRSKWRRTPVERIKLRASLSRPACPVLSKREEARTQAGTRVSGFALASHASGQGEETKPEGHQCQDGPLNPNLWRRQLPLSGFLACRADLVFSYLRLQVRCWVSQDVSRSLH